ncbi:hypothetical protein WJX74_001717 [Apatococcus lobatus]|uniref:Uncharacterized protein n=1 Tax=Apatococcus lobatus TaxID=904363 RepID=A0AAW1SDX3_9CHLO
MASSRRGSSRRSGRATIRSCGSARSSSSATRSTATSRRRFDPARGERNSDPDKGKRKYRRESWNPLQHAPRKRAGNAKGMEHDMSEMGLSERLAASTNAVARRRYERGSYPYDGTPLEVGTRAPYSRPGTVEMNVPHDNDDKLLYFGDFYFLEHDNVDDNTKGLENGYGYVSAPHLSWKFDYKPAEHRNTKDTPGRKAQAVYRDALARDRAGAFVRDRRRYLRHRSLAPGSREARIAANRSRGITQEGLDAAWAEKAAKGLPGPSAAPRAAKRRTANGGPSPEEGPVLDRHADALQRRRRWVGAVHHAQHHALLSLPERLGGVQHPAAVEHDHRVLRRRDALRAAAQPRAVAVGRAALPPPVAVDQGHEDRHGLPPEVVGVVVPRDAVPRAVVHQQRARVRPVARQGFEGLGDPAHGLHDPAHLRRGVQRRAQRLCLSQGGVWHAAALARAGYARPPAREPARLHLRDEERRVRQQPVPDPVALGPGGSQGRPHVPRQPRQARFTGPLVVGAHPRGLGKISARRSQTVP